MQLPTEKDIFEVVDGGTIFLDEVGELPLSTQVRLLRVLEAGEFIKVGSSKTQKTNVRVVAATNLNMVQATRDGKFREDLFYRLNTVPIAVPALRERKDDIVLLFRKFASDFAEKYRMPSIKLTDDAKILLSNYYWNGNVRQLNITEQISVIEQQREISAHILRSYLPKDDMERLPALFSAAMRAALASSSTFLMRAETALICNASGRFLTQIFHVSTAQITATYYKTPIYANLALS